MTDFQYQPLFELEPEDTPYRPLGSEGVSRIELAGRNFLQVEPDALTQLAAEAYTDVSFLLRPGHLGQLRRILDDPEASENERFVALELLKNANIASGRVLPSCQDTGTAIVLGHKGEQVLTFGDD
ncbi:MAG: fumarate hydratase, partial [Myxococcota bacterium]|nr:fumarate hydratase [Myxococcota bacterium]